MIVADANIVAALYFDGADTENARLLLEIDGDWIVPGLWRHEMLNIAANYATFTQSSTARVAAAWESADAQFAGRIHAVDMGSALALAVKHGISAYDAQYVALAQELNVWLVTQDKKLRDAMPSLTLSLRDAMAKVQ